MTASTDPAASSAHLQRIAQGAVQLAALVPKLAALAEAIEMQSQEQARSAATAAQASAAVVTELEQSVRELGSCSAQMSGALLTVRRIADQTKILSINASIEAARAGVWGRAFGVVVEEVKQLAETTTGTTTAIENQVEAMQSRVARVSAAAGLAEAEVDSIAAVNRRVAEMAGSARRQLDGAQELHRMGDQVEALAEGLLLAVGKFRFDAHAVARAALEELLQPLAGSDGRPEQAEEVLTRWLQRHRYFELAYATDADGRQFVDNIVRRGDAIERDASARGRHWTDRPWFQEASRTQGVCVTDIYRSAATRDFCFTAASAWRTPRGLPGGVVAADVNFHRLLARDMAKGPGPHDRDPWPVGVLP